MSRWRNALIAASVGSVATLSFVVLPSVPASAAPADLVIDYECTPVGPSSIVRHGPVRLTTNLTFATDLAVGDPLNFAWKLNYTGDGSRLQSPGYFGSGAQVHAIGNVELRREWVGILQPMGSSDPEDELRPDDPLGLPPMLNDPGLTNKAGTIKITPKNIELDFTPPDGSVVINDGDDTDNPSDMKIVYGNGIWANVDDRPGSEHHVHNDLHETSDLGATAELVFVGTSVKYIGPHDKDAGPVDIYIDGVKRATVDPSRDGNDDPVNADLDGGQTLWESPTLTYGKHKIKVQNASTKPAWVDAFEVSTTTSKTPTGYHSALCKPVATPVSIEVTVRERTSPTNSVSPSPSGSPSTSPTNNGSPSSTPTGTQPNHTNPTQTINPPPIVAVNPRATGTTTTTATPRTTGPTATKYVRAQVSKIPQGGVDSGEAPDGPQEAPYGLMAGGAMVMMGSAGGGLLLRRRRAAHAGGAN